MMRAACEGAQPARVLAVTVLTSLDLEDLHEDGIAAQSTQEQVLRRARLARAAGCHGVVASPLEARAVRAEHPAPFLVVTPGVRPSGGGDHGDQKRVATPLEARAAGADHIVVGRPIRDAVDPRAEVERIVEELS
jgi:orotidine-5'-phosphate decarboxylase